MNRLEFMNQLEALLGGMPEAERKEAMQYYEDYFNDAGVESEQEVLESLGSPEKIAQTIQSEIGMNQKAFDNDKIECRENKEKQAEAVYGNTAAAPGAQEKKSGLSAGMITLIVILCIFGSPILLGLGGTVLSLVASIITTLFALILTCGLISIGFLVCAVILVGVGIVKMFISPLGGLMLIGTGMVFGGFALLFLLLTIWLTATVTPAFFKGLVWLCKAPFGKNA